MVYPGDLRRLQIEYLWDARIGWSVNIPEGELAFPKKNPNVKESKSGLGPFLSLS